MSISTIYQDLKVISNDINGLSFINGALNFTTGGTKPTEIVQGSESRFKVDEAGSISLTARENQNISLTTSGSGRINLSGLDLAIHGVKKETVVIDHSVKEKALTIITPNQGAQSMYISGTTEGASDCNAVFLCAKRVGASGICNAFTTIAGSESETLKVDWQNNTILLKLVGGTLANYEPVLSSYDVRIVCSH